MFWVLKSVFYLLATNWVTDLSVKLVKNQGMMVTFKIEEFDSFTEQVLKVKKLSFLHGL